MAETGAFPTGSLDDILKRAHRRYVANLLIQQAGIAVSAGAAGVILLLLFGTQILNWQWPVALFFAVLAIGVYRVRRLVLPSYRIAQIVDRLLGLEDRLSTAFYFRRLAPNSRQPQHAIDIVEKQAIERVHPLDLDRALPLSFPRSGYAACAAVLAAAGMFGLRYGIMRTMDLQRPIANITFDTFGAPPRVEAASAKKSVTQEHLEKQLEQLGLSLDDLPQPEIPGQTPTLTNVPAVAEEQGGNVEGKPGKGPNTGSEGSEDGKGDEQSSEKQTGEAKEEGAGQSPSPEKGSQPGATPKAQPKNAGTNSGVLDKMKDALANLLNKLGSDAQQKSETASAQQQQGGKQQMSQKGTQGQGKSQGESQQTPDPQGGQDADAGDKAPGQQENASQQASEKAGSENSKSGMGKTDGDKSIKDAEQLAAMGKISEIFGKRAAEIQGEMSVEVPSGKQQLKTAYSRSSATHSGAVAESDRNEIPLIYQSYVQRYFEEVRKTAPAKPKTAAP